MALRQHGPANLEGDTISDRPSFGNTGRYFFDRATARMFFDTGAAWTEITAVAESPLDRQIILTTTQFRKGATAPSDVTIGTTPTIPALRFAATNELLSILQVMPFNWDKTQDIELILIWSLVSTEINGDAISITVDYTATQFQATGEGIAKTSTQITDDLAVTTGEGLAIGDLYSHSITIAENDATNPLADADAVALEIHLTNLTGVASVDLVGACFNYKAPT